MQVRLNHGAVKEKVVIKGCSLQKPGKFVALEMVVCNDLNHLVCMPDMLNQGMN